MNFDETYKSLVDVLLDQEPIHRGEWQSMNTAHSHAHSTRELLRVTVAWPVPADQYTLAADTGADMPWAEDHFLERVSGTPHNPPPSHTAWPWAVRENTNHTDAQGRFDHTYPERFWPTHPNNCHEPYAPAPDGGVQTVDRHGHGDYGPVCKGMRGIRYRYGDLSDVVDLLVRNPLTRQAFLPVWFPEDTGAHHGQRVPCTIGYHFIMDAERQMHIVYYIRSCDMVRHFRNDVYLAARLLQWVCEQVNDREAIKYGTERVPITHGTLTMHITSLHSFIGDDWRLRGETAKS